VLCNQNKVYKPALERAVKQAENNQANLVVVDVAERIASAGIGPDGRPVFSDLQAAQENTCAQRLTALVDPYRKRIDIKIKVLRGSLHLEVIREVIRHQHDILIKVPESSDWLNRLFGSNDMHLLRKCPCPVWMVKPDSTASSRCILAPVDIAETDSPAEYESSQSLNRQIVDMAWYLTRLDGAQLKRAFH